MGGGGELSLLRPPAFLDADEMESRLLRIDLELRHAPGGHRAPRGFDRGIQWQYVGGGQAP
eukprot:4176263-Alexandrium_andersonii.AAC.1